jgi:cell division control protein 6
MTTTDEDINDYIVILLDEVDYIGSDDDLLYQFSRAGKANQLTATVCVIGLSNQVGFHRDLSDSTLSTLKPRDITFGEYESGTIQDILWDRIDLAFSNGVVDESAVALAGSTAAADGGDARIGLDLIEEAGDIARSDDDDLVTDDHVRVAVERTKDREIINQLTAIRDQHKVIIAALLKATLTNAVPIGRSNLFVEYRTYAEELLGEFHTSRWLHDQLVDLSKRNIVTVIHRGHGNQYELNVNPDLTVKGLRQASIEGGIPAIPHELGEFLNNSTSEVYSHSENPLSMSTATSSAVCRLNP